LFYWCWRQCCLFFKKAGYAAVDALNQINEYFDQSDNSLQVSAWHYLLHSTRRKGCNTEKVPSFFSSHTILGNLGSLENVCHIFSQFADFIFQ